MNNNNRIEIKRNASYAIFPQKEINGNVLFSGELFGAFGIVGADGKINGGELAWNNVGIVTSAVKSNHEVFFIVPDYVSEYINDVANALVKKGYWAKKDCKKMRRSNKYETLRRAKEQSMKFDYIIQNPPYKGSLHLDFLEKGLDLLTEDGKMVIIEPATWLINVRKNGKAKKYDAIKRRIEGHVESVVIENLNKDFGTRLYMPFATTTIDMSKTFETIKFVCCGEEKDVKSIYDCNLIGDYATVWNILDKCQKFGDMMENHITRKNESGNFYYTKYQEILGSDCVGCGAITERGGMTYEGETLWTKSENGDYERGYFSPTYHHMLNSISETPVCSCDSGKHLTDKIADNVYGTREELENWRHFIFNNKLPLFLNIVLTIDQHNNSKPYLPWLVDKQYADEEINEMFEFTKEEIKLIDFTIKKYERNSPWFKRYMCGPDSVSNDDVNNFIESISE